MIVLVLVVYSSVMVPYDAAFMPNKDVMWFDTVVDICFYADIGLNFWTGFDRGYEIVMDKDQIPFTYEQVAQGVYKLTPETALEKGQYGFIFAVGGGAGPGLVGSAGTAGARVFAFGVGE